MMRSLYSGVAGLKTHQIKMDVIGNNIANVNTVAYKSSSVTFSELMYQTSQNASGANAATGRGGINPKQIGLGVKSGAIATAIETEGASQNTGNPFDIQIAGSSFFVVNDGSTNYFTRAGAFTVDSNGTLVMTTNGYNVMGWQADAEGNIIKDSVSALQIMSEANMTADPEATTRAYMAGIIDSNDTNLDPSGNGLISTIEFYDAKGYSYTAKFAVKSVLDTTTNEPIDGEFTLECIDVLDSNAKSIFAGMSDADKAAALSDVMGGTAPIDLNYDATKGTFSYVGAAGQEAFTFEATALAGINAAFTEDIEVNMSTTKNIDNKKKSTLNGKSGTIGQADLGAGRSVGEMDTIAIATDGKITATYTNGITRILGQIAVANFANPSGLKKEGDNLYSATQNSGQFDGIGQDVTADGGGFSTGVLEMSNVDLSSEFTEMITTQRGFQANSRIITVSDTMIEELVNLKR